jgi:RsiW-degrading membrane proteinase PrsW (M82 family)
MSLFGVAVLLISLVVSTSALLLVVAAVWFVDRYDREPLHTVVGVFLWGGAGASLLAVLIVGFLERLLAGAAITPSPYLTGAVIVPAVEELAKGLGIAAVILLSRDFDNPTDGFVYGTAAGLGFAVTENYLYTTAAGGNPASDIRTILTLVVGRTLLSAGIHAVSSGTLGGMLGYALLSRQRLARMARAGTGTALAVLIHGGWNATLMAVGPLSPSGAPRLWLLVVPCVYAAFVLILLGFLRSEQTIIKRQLQEEVELGLLPPWVVEIVPYYRRRLKSDWWPARRERAVIARLLTRLAFRKQALSTLAPRDASLPSLEVVKIRQRLREILGPATSDRN